MLIYFSILSAFLRQTYQEEGPLSPASIESLDAQQLHQLLLAYYRILQANRSLPNNLLWPLSPLARLIRTPHPDTGVRFLAIRCYCLQSGTGEAERVEMEKEVIGDVSEVDCPIAYGLNVDGTASLMDGWIFPTFEVKRISDARNAIMQGALDYYSLDEGEVVEPITVEELRYALFSCTPQFGCSLLFKSLHSQRPWNPSVQEPACTCASFNPSHDTWRCKISAAASSVLVSSVPNPSHLRTILRQIAVAITSCRCPPPRSGEPNYHHPSRRYIVRPTFAPGILHILSHETRNFRVEGRRTCARHEARKMGRL